MLGDGLVQIGMLSKHVSDDDRAKYPTVKFNEIQIGEDAVALIVSRDVWDGGVHALTSSRSRTSTRAGSRTGRTWAASRSASLSSTRNRGRGTWEVFAHWAYGNPKAAPQVSFPEVGGNEETRNKVSSTRGALSQLSSSWADGKKVFALGIKLEDGSVVDPTNENIANKKYPLSRSLLLLTNGEPTGVAKTYVEFMLSDRGQDLVKKHGYMRLKDLSK